MGYGTICRLQLLLLKIVVIGLFVCLHTGYFAGDAKPLAAKVSLGRYSATVTRGNEKELSSLLSAGADPNAVLWDGYFKLDALTLAVRSKSLPCVEILLKHGANPNGSLKYSMSPNDLDFSTPLTVAVGVGLPMVKLLLDKRADVNYQVNGSTTALMVAAYHDDLTSVQTNLAIINFLRRHGANLDLKERMGRTALIQAADFESESGPICNTDAVKLLVRLGANVNLRDKRGRSALMYVANSCGASEYEDERAERELTDCVRLLLSHGARTDFKDWHGNTALQLAQQNSHSKIVKLIRKHSS